LNNGARLMIVEDSIDYQILLKRLFQKEGFEVSAAVHGGDALAKLKGDQPLPNLILLDLMMPVMDGFEFRQKQLDDERLAAIPVILMTAHGNLETDPARLGIEHYLRKPVEKNQLLTLVKSILERDD
jgi:CheY-like chemotaxis protein